MPKKHLKTDMLMKVAFPHGTIEIYHKTEMGNLKQVFNMGNKYRLDNNESTIELEKFLKRQVTKNFISTLMEVNGCERNDIIKVVGRGRGAITYANLQFLIYCAMAEHMARQFQRSSSAVEGRNGCLSQMYRNGRGLNKKRLNALTVIHNYGIKREDG